MLMDGFCRFNPIAPTFLTKALQALLNTHFAESKKRMPSKEVLDIVVQSSNGDIRSAVMAMQFACTADAISAKAKPGKRKSPGDDTATKESTRAFLECITRREQSLALFHLLGKVFYNKRTSLQIDPLPLIRIG